jgi:G6PDH family F420-dependent oxidoreductase
MMPGRFFLGVGSGENLNEHIVGERWPLPDERLELLEEAVEVIRLLWQGGYQTHRGKHYRVEKARIYTLPDELPPIAFAAGGPRAAELAARLGDALVTVAPKKEIVDAYEQAGGKGPRYGQATVCWARSEEEARKTAHELWPTAGLKGSLNQELPAPSDFEAAAEMVSEDDVAELIVCGPDPERHLESIREFEQAGFDHVYVHQVGPDQEGFFRFYREEILPKL